MNPFVKEITKVVGFLAIGFGVAMVHDRLWAVSAPTETVKISVQKIENGVIYFAPLIPASFSGELSGDISKGIHKCSAHDEPLADTKDDKGVVHITRIVLECGVAHITVRGVSWP
jgi:hypothetical protein